MHTLASYIAISYMNSSDHWYQGNKQQHMNNCNCQLYWYNCADILHWNQSIHWHLYNIIMLMHESIQLYCNYLGNCVHLLQVCIHFDTNNDSSQQCSYNHDDTHHLMLYTHQYLKIWLHTIQMYQVTGPAKIGHIYTNYTCSEIGTFLGHCLWQTHSVNFIYFLIDL